MYPPSFNFQFSENGGVSIFSDILNMVVDFRNFGMLSSTKPFSMLGNIRIEGLRNLFTSISVMSNFCHSKIIVNTAKITVNKCIQSKK